MELFKTAEAPTRRRGHTLPTHEWTHQGGEARGWRHPWSGTQSCPWWQQQIDSTSRKRSIHLVEFLILIDLTVLRRLCNLSMQFCLKDQISVVWPKNCELRGYLFLNFLNFTQNYRMTWPALALITKRNVWKGNDDLNINKIFIFYKSIVWAILRARVSPLTASDIKREKPSNLQFTQSKHQKVSEQMGRPADFLKEILTRKEQRKMKETK